VFLGGVKMINVPFKQKKRKKKKTRTIENGGGKMGEGKKRARVNMCKSSQRLLPKIN
jgi:hypothetical protein